MHWRLPNSAKNLAEAEFGKNGRISAWPKPKPKFGATVNDSRSCWIVFIHVVRGRPGGLLRFSRGFAVKIKNLQFKLNTLLPLCVFYVVNCAQSHNAEVFTLSITLMEDDDRVWASSQLNRNLSSNVNYVMLIASLSCTAAEVAGRCELLSCCDVTSACKCTSLHVCLSVSLSIRLSLRLHISLSVCLIAGWLHIWKIWKSQGIQYWLGRSRGN